VADPSHQDGKPAVSPEGPLRALRVPNPGTGVNYEPRVRLASIFADYRDGAAGVAMPEAAFSQSILPVAAVANGYQVNVGPRGAWIVASNDTAGGAQNLALLRYDSEAQAAADGEATTVIAPAIRRWSINGGIRSTVIVYTSTGANSGLMCVSSGSIPAAFPLLMLHHQTGAWCPPGSLFRVFNPTPGFAATPRVVVREPVSGP
jgi:hypothetical protein